MDGALPVAAALHRRSTARPLRFTGAADRDYWHRLRYEVGGQLINAEYRSLLA
jgi:hypothetical protein